MKKTINIPVSDIIPSLDAVLALQGVPPGAELQPQVINSAKTALQLFTELALPLSKIAYISRDKFEPIFNGIGLNDSTSPIEAIYKKSSQMALFAATVGPLIGEKISALFAAGDFVLGNHLDAAASTGTDLISRELEKHFKADLIRQARGNRDTVVRAYSPGYCGWHISAQKALFEFLKPDEIGISLRNSFLMEPLKSISGVLLAGPNDIHLFDPTFTFCSQCKSKPCRERMRS